MAMRSSWTRVAAASFLPLVSVASSLHSITSLTSIHHGCSNFGGIGTFLFCSFIFYLLASVVLCSFICWRHWLFFLPASLHRLDLRCLMPALTPSTLCWVVGSAPWHAAVSCPSAYAGQFSLCLQSLSLDVLTQRKWTNRDIKTPPNSVSYLIFFIVLAWFDCELKVWPLWQCIVLEQLWYASQKMVHFWQKKKKVWSVSNRIFLGHLY